MRLCSVLEEMRAVRKITQQKIADDCKKTQREISFIENGRRHIGPELLSLLVDYYQREKEISAEEWGKIFECLITETITGYADKLKINDFSQRRTIVDGSYSCSINTTIPGNRYFLWEMHLSENLIAKGMVEDTVSLIRRVVALSPERKQLISAILDNFVDDRPGAVPDGRMLLVQPKNSSSVEQVRT